MIKPALSRPEASETLFRSDPSLRQEASPRIAVLIDADNAQASIFVQVLGEIAKYGDATVKRLYGDFSENGRMARSWSDIIKNHAIKPIHQPANTKGKNATDIALIIDAMDLLYSGKFDTFCIVSSDSDFTSLAMRIREEGLFVLGIGENKTPLSFINACNRFVDTQVFRLQPLTVSPVARRARAATGNKTDAVKPDQAKPDQAGLKQTEVSQSTSGRRKRSQAETSQSEAGQLKTTQTKTTQTKTTQTKTSQPEIDQPEVVQTKTAQTKTGDEAPDANGPLPIPQALLIKALQEASDETGWASLGPLGSYLNKINPGFDSRLYGFSRLSDLVRSQDKLFEFEERANNTGTHRHLYLRLQ